MPVHKDTIERLMGKRVHLETTEFHHVLGLLSARREGRLLIVVSGREVLVSPAAVASLTEAAPHEAEYLK